LANARGETGIRFGQDPVTRFFGGNTITSLFLDLDGFSATEVAATAAEKGMGNRLSHGRRTTDILSLNLKGKGGRPLALSSAPSAGIKNFLKRLAAAPLKLAADVAFTGALLINCGF
jgi:hypothetical protein